jgi:Phosphoesterase family
VEGQNIRIEWQFAGGRRRFRFLKQTRETAIGDRAAGTGSGADPLGAPSPSLPGQIGPGVSGFNFDRLGVRVGAIVVSPYVTPGVSHTLFEHASIPATATQQFIGPPARHAPYRREQNAPTMQQLLIDMAPRMERPDFDRPPRRSESDDDRVIPVSLSRAHAPDRPASVPTRPASSLQLEHVRDVHQLLAFRKPTLARALDPRGITTQREVAQFMRAALAVLHSEVEDLDS